MFRSHSSQTFKKAGLGLVASLVLVAPFASSPAVAQTGCGRVAGNWTSVAGPSFPSGGKAITALAVGPADPDQMYVTNGAVVMRSSSEGCSWARSLEASLSGGIPAAGGSVQISALEAPGNGRTAYAAVQETIGPASRPRVMTTDDGGASWQEASAGLPPAGAPALLRPAPGDPRTVYLGISVQGVVELLYGSDDGGVSWTPRSNFSRSVGAGVTDLRVDPQNPTELWAGAVDGLYHSTDGGRSFTPVPEFAGGPAGPIDIAHPGGKPASVMAFRAAAGGALVSEDGGQTWLQVASPGNPTSVAHGAIPQFRMIGAASRVWVYTPTLFNWVDAKAPVSGISGLIGATTANPAFYGFTGSTIEIYKGPVGASVDLPGGELVLPDQSLLDPGAPPPDRPAKLSPNERVVNIDAGDSKTLPYRLLVPKSRTPLDVYFVIDTSSSQRRFIVQMAEALGTIVNELVASGADVQMGLAEYRNYPDADPPRLGPEGSPFYEPNFVYRQRQPIAPTTAGIEQALETLEPAGGGHYNAQLEALYQAATGEGYDSEPVGPAGNDVPPGLSADFRRSALKVAVLVSDEAMIDRPLSEDQTPPALRGFEETAAALRASNIKQVGLSLAYKGTAHATADMQEMARRTDATAPSSGVDCDGDGSPDVAAGDALVCTLSREELGEDTALASAIVNLVESIRTRETISLAVAGKDEVTQKVTPDLYESVVLQSTNALTFDVTFRCPMSLAGKSFPLRLTAKGIDGAVSSTATVKCRSIAESKKDDLLPIPFERVLGLIPLVPVSPPPPITELASSTQAQAQSQAQAQAQASMAAQRQQQPQLAFVHAVHAMRQKVQEEYAMSSFRAPMEVPATALALGAATALMSAAFGLAMGRQRRVRTASARRRH